MNALRLPEISSEQIQLYNSIVGKRRRASFEMAEKHFEMVFCLKPEDYNPAVFFKLKLSDYILWMGLSEFPALEYFSPHFKDISFEKVAPEVQNILLETVFDTVISIAENNLGISVKIDELEVEPKPEPLKEIVYFKVQSKEGNAIFHGHLTFDFIALQFLGSLLGAFGAIPSAIFEEVPVPCRVVMGEETIKASDFRKLSKRDIILFTGKPFFLRGECRVSFADKLFFLATYKNGVVTLKSIMEKNKEETEVPQGSEELEEREENASDKQPTPPKEAKALSGPSPASVGAATAPRPVAKAQESEDLEDAGELTAELPIRLTFEVGQKQIALKELRNIQSGFTFELDSPVERPVTMRANGVVVGSGELLQVGDRIGVRVISLKK